MKVNLDVDGYTKTLNHRKIIPKIQKNNNLLKTKTILKPKYKLSGGSVYTFSLPRWGNSALFPLSVTSPAYDILYLHIMDKLCLLDCNKMRAGGVA